jgi:predicted ribosome quality control (RQC) complex YloA/Tae2 family protein
MYHSYYFLSRLSGELSRILPGYRLVECFSQAKEELILAWYMEGKEEFWIKADLSPGAGILSFPNSFARTRGPSVDLFPRLIGSPVSEIVQTPMDRSFHIVFANGLQLCFKMYGHRSNLLIHNGIEVLEVFRHSLRQDVQSGIPLGIPGGCEVWNENPVSLKAMNPTFNSRILEAWISYPALNGQETPENRFDRFIHHLKTGPIYLVKEGNRVRLDFFEKGEVLQKSQEAIPMSNSLYQAIWQITRFEQEKESQLTYWRKSVGEAEHHLQALARQIVNGEEGNKYRLQADLLMAYGQGLATGLTEVDLPDFETGKPIRITLKRDLSVSGNAERLYRKARGLQEDLNRVRQNLQSWQKTMEDRKAMVLELESARKWSELKSLQKPGAHPIQEEALPYHQHFFMDYEIWVGKSAKSNDEILRLAHKNDLWMHARDAPGSHILVRHKAGKTTPNPVLERAAALAAFHSKARTEGLCPVMVTERKYVRKRKGMAAGQVFVEREKTLLVKPEA